MYTVTLMMGTNDVSIGESRKMKRLQEKVSCILDELRVYLDPTVLTICTITHNMMADQNAMSTNEMVRHINGIIGQVQQRSVLPVELLDFDSSSDGIHFDKPKATEWLNGVFQRQINSLEPDLVEKGQFTFGPPPTPSFFPARPVANRLGGRIDSRGSSKRSRSRQLGLTHGGGRNGVFHTTVLGHSQVPGASERFGSGGSSLQAGAIGGLGTQESVA